MSFGWFPNTPEVHEAVVGDKDIYGELGEGVASIEASETHGDYHSGLCYCICYEEIQFYPV